MPAAANLRGVRIENVGPIQRCYVPLRSPFTVLYGLNGAGKTTILDVLAQALEHGTVESQAKAIPIHRRTDSSVLFYLTTKDWSFDASRDPDPWDPWQALWSGANERLREHFGQECSDRGSDRAEGELLREVVEQCFESKLFPWAAEAGLMGEESEDDEAPLVLFTELVLSAAVGLNLAGDEGEPITFDSGFELFWPIAEAFKDRAIAVRVGPQGRSVSLCVSQDGPSTRDWQIRLRQKAAELLGLPPDTEDVIREAKRLVAGISDTGHDGVTEALEQIFPTTGPSDGDGASDEASAFQEMARNLALYEFRLHGSELLNKMDPDSALMEEFGHRSDCLMWDSVIAGLLGVEPPVLPPSWARDEVVRYGHDPGPLPFGVLYESAPFAGFESVRRLVDLVADEPVGFVLPHFPSLWFQRRRVRRPHAFDADVLVTGDGLNYSIHPQLSEIASSIQQEANRIFPMLLVTDHTLRVFVNRPTFWATQGPLGWSTTTRDGRELEPGQLSAAELRWAQFSVRLADAILGRDGEASPLIVLIDEPERALHRKAERALVRGLKRLAEELDLRLIVSSHSPSFLARSDAELVFVRRDTHGNTVTESVPTEMLSRTGDLGLESGDLLHLQRAFLIVEGEHDEAVLDVVIGDELRDLGVVILTMKGTKAVGAADAQMLKRFTDVPFVFLVDNADPKKLRDLWSHACSPNSTREQRQRFLGALGGNREFVTELLGSFRGHSAAARVTLTSFSNIDILDYLNPADLVPQGRRHELVNKTFADLRREAGKDGRWSAGFKSFMRMKYGMKTDRKTVRAASTRITTPPEFSDLIRHLEQEIHRHRTSE